MDGIRMDAATGSVFDAIGEWLVQAGKEDASGARRAIANRLAARDYVTAAQWLGTTPNKAKGLAHRFAAQLG